MHLALNLLKQKRSAKGGIKAKRKKAGWGFDYLLKVLSQWNAIALDTFGHGVPGRSFYSIIAGDLTDKLPTAPNLDMDKEFWRVVGRNLPAPLTALFLPSILLGLFVKIYLPTLKSTSNDQLPLSSATEYLVVAVSWLPAVWFVCGIIGVSIRWWFRSRRGGSDNS